LSWIFCLTVSIWTSERREGDGEKAERHLKGDGLARERLHEDLHATAEHEVERGLLLL
jgi:hypothetical protein